MGNAIYIDIDYSSAQTAIVRSLKGYNPSHVPFHLIFCSIKPCRRQYATASLRDAAETAFTKIREDQVPVSLFTSAFKGWSHAVNMNSTHACKWTDISGFSSLTRIKDTSNIFQIFDFLLSPFASCYQMCAWGGIDRVDATTVTIPSTILAVNHLSGTGLTQIESTSEHIPAYRDTFSCILIIVTRTYSLLHQFNSNWLLVRALVQ